MTWVCLTSSASQLFCQKPHLDVSFDFVDFFIFLEFSLFFFESASRATFRSQDAVSPRSRMMDLIFSPYSNSWRLRHVMLVKLLILWLVRLFDFLTSLMSWAVRTHLSSFERILLFFEDFGMLCLWSCQFFDLWDFSALWLPWCLEPSEFICHHLGEYFV